jgi:hypothetical protein
MKASDTEERIGLELHGNSRRKSSSSNNSRRKRRNERAESRGTRARVTGTKRETGGERWLAILGGGRQTGLVAYAHR